jgi:hypothetical protein
VEDSDAFVYLRLLDVSIPDASSIIAITVLTACSGRL